MLVAQHLRTQLAALEAAGQLRGEVLLLPMANPLGLAQQLLGQVQGRFDLHDGLNFNRGHADLSEAAAAIAGPALGADLAHNRSQVRAALRQAAAALVEFLRRRGIVEGTPVPLPPARCRPTPLAASEPVTAPHAGIVIYHRVPGDRVEAGGTIADLIDPVAGTLTPVRAQSAGVLYARSATRWARPGQRLAKIAGTTLQRSGKLLSP
jgi:predicted deacylase